MGVNTHPLNTLSHYLIGHLGGSSTAEIGLDSHHGPRKPQRASLSLEMMCIAGLGDVAAFFFAFAGLLGLHAVPQASTDGGHSALLIRLGVFAILTFFCHSAKLRSL